MAFEKKVEIPGSRREPIAGATAARAIDNNEVVHATVVLRRRTQAPTPESFAFSDPQTANHHPREDYGLIHGAAPADIASIEAFAHEYGLTVTECSRANHRHHRAGRGLPNLRFEDLLQGAGDHSASGNIRIRRWRCQQAHCR